MWKKSVSLSRITVFDMGALVPPFRLVAQSAETGEVIGRGGCAVIGGESSPLTCFKTAFGAQMCIVMCAAVARIVAVCDFRFN